MANRNNDYREIIAQNFNSKEYARLFFIHLVEDEGLEIKDTLKECIKAMGLANFAKRSGLSIQSVSDFVAGRKNWSSDKVAKHVTEIFKVKVRLALDVA